MKPATAYAVAAAALDWEDRRADRADAKRARADAIRAFCEEHGADSHDDDCLEATKGEHAAYMKAVKAEKSARQRMRAQVARARAEIDGMKITAKTKRFWWPHPYAAERGLLWVKLVIGYDYDPRPKL